MYIDKTRGDNQAMHISYFVCFELKIFTDVLNDAIGYI